MKRAASRAIAALLFLVGIVGAGVGGGRLAHAQAFPVKPVRLVVPFPPGGPLDAAGRIVARELQERWGQNVIVDNKAGSTLGAEFLIRSAPDGYTLMIISSSPLVTFPHLQKAPYDVETSFTPLIQTASLTYALLAHPASGLTSLDQLIETARKSPGKLNLAIGSLGSGQHLYAELFRMASGAMLTHVPYKGAGPASQGFISGEVDAIIDVTSGAIPLVRAGKARALMVTGGKTVPQLPEAVPFDARYPGRGIPTWHGIFAPAGLSSALAESIAADIGAAVASPAVSARFRDLGLEPGGVAGEAFRAMVVDDYRRWGEVIRENGIVVR